jgi:tripartite-type tricarboxylate transporter receptor subunit TctC
MRRRLALLAAAAALALAPFHTRAQSFPERPVRIVVPYSAGGATDVAARVLAEALTAALPQPVVVENRSGAAGMVGAEAVARSPADGHTLLLNNASHAVLRVVAPNPGLDPHRALLPVTVFSEMPMVMLVANNVPARDGREFLVMVRAEPGRHDYGSTGGGGTLGMAALLLTTTAGLRMNEIPYRGGAPATLDVAAGRIAMVFDAAVTGLQTARGGQARAFAVTGPRRSPTAPDVPTWREIGVNAEMLLWQALFVPAATPVQVRAALHAAFARVQADLALRRRWAELGVDRAMALPPAESEAYVAAEVARWERVIGGGRGGEPAAR